MRSAITDVFFYDTTYFTERQKLASTICIYALILKLNIQIGVELYALRFWMKEIFLHGNRIFNIFACNFAMVC